MSPRVVLLLPAAPTRRKVPQELPLLQDIGESRKVACHYPLYDYQTSDDVKLG